MEKHFYYYFQTIFLFIVLLSIKNNLYGQVVAQDGTKYKTIKIGTSEWLKSNLNVNTFANGIPILEVKTVADWRKAFNEQKPAYCYYDFKDINEIKYGKLYNWFAIINAGKLAPIGWHIPSGDEWNELKDFLGSDIKTISLKLKSKKGWLGGKNENANGDNTSGFTALPGGYLNRYSFAHKGRLAVYWGTDYRPHGGPFFLVLNSRNTLDGQAHDYNEGFSVRCIKNK